MISVDPSTLGVLAAPASFGADIVCGDIQPLGIHAHYGGGHAGFIATHDEERFVNEYPSRLFGIAPTIVYGEYGFGDVAYDRTSFAKRELGKEWVGTAAALWGITAGVYLALMGPQGMTELGEGLMARTRYAIDALGAIPGVTIPFRKRHHIKEFVALAPVYVHRNHPGTSRRGRGQRPQDFPIARVNGPHAVAVSCRGNLERAVTREIHERVFDRSRLSRAALVGRIIRPPQAMPNRSSVGVEQRENVWRVQQHFRGFFAGKPPNHWLAVGRPRGQVLSARQFNASD